VAGNPDLPVRGIATTFMSTFDTLRRANEAGLSLIISHEPTFWHHQDSVEGLAGDPTYELKKRYAEENGLTIWRFHDHWHMRKPDPILSAFMRKLGLDADSFDDTVELPSMRLGDLVRKVQTALDTPNVRFWGDPDRMVQRMRVSGHLLRQIAGQNADVFLWLEPKEFNTFEYFRDAGELGVDRCIIGTTHELVEEWGMLAPCADWVRALVPEVPVKPLRTAELYWTV
jgi:putative NIF3 family GTP cyclohydrolase 1 type 2